MRLYQFVATATGALGVQMLSAGSIACVLWNIRQGTYATGDGCTAELSMQGSSQWSIHNPVGIISFINSLVHQGTNVGYYGADRWEMHNGLYCPVKVGDIVYLNSVITNTCTVKALLHVQEGR